VAIPPVAIPPAAIPPVAIPPVAIPPVVTKPPVPNPVAAAPPPPPDACWPPEPGLPPLCKGLSELVDPQPTRVRQVMTAIGSIFDFIGIAPVEEMIARLPQTRVHMPRVGGLEAAARCLTDLILV
jgi:hypothetical protein